MDEASVTREQRDLALALHALRRDAGLSGPQLAERLGWTQSKVSKIERTRTAPTAEDVERWAAETGADPEQAARLANLAGTQITVQSQRSAEAMGVSRRQREIARMEAASTQIRGFQHGMIPGIMQTAEYTRALLSLARIGRGADLAATIAGRLQRQLALQNQGKTFRFVVTEAALRAHYLAPELMREQVARILTTEALPNVTLGVLPLDASPPIVYSDGFLMFDEPGQVTVLVETRSTDMFLRKLADVAVFERAFEDAAAAAIYGRRARSLIRAALT